ncbi:hypothetical protein BJ742DRAFT_518818 [Cladochytrium replicatum]|nr:hypothetical protein BJ742DRAFT_518818 [Cladochytrium replicatum]
MYPQQPYPESTHYYFVGLSRTYVVVALTYEIPDKRMSQNRIGLLSGCGIATGLTIAMHVWFHIKCGREKLWGARNHSIRQIYVVAILNILYYVIKFLQIDGTNGNCGLYEVLSIIFYFGCHTVLYAFFISRYWEVYGWENKKLIPAVVLLVAFVAAIPAYINNNKVAIIDGKCTVYHPPLSALIPAILTFVISVYLLALFLIPLVRILGAIPDPATSTTVPPPPTPWLIQPTRKTQKPPRIAWMIFITNAVAIISTVLFNATVSTPAGDWASMTSALDLCINHVMISIPYLASKIGEHSNAETPVIMDSVPICDHAAPPGRVVV